MVGVTYDFGILGDGQPEGLFVAAGLVRKGFSVLIVPSSALGEAAPEPHLPSVFPSEFGTKRLNDLLFRSGFFRLEESGLVPSPFESQIVLKRHRLYFDGSRERFHSEVDREFPMISEALLRVWDGLRKPGAQVLQRSAVEIQNLQKQEPSLKSWVSAEAWLSGNLKNDFSQESLKIWLEEWLKQGSKSYRVDPKLREPYHHFLLNHCRKWGAQVWSDRLDLKASWGAFQISPNTKVKNFIINGVGGGRSLSKWLSPKVSDRMQYWMYLDRIECSLDAVPEPLRENCQIDLQEGIADTPTVRSIHCFRDLERKEAHLSIGSWLPFEDSKAWVTQIEMGRKALRKLLPFVSEETFKPIPNLLDLTEIRGDCIKRGQAERLKPFQEPKSRWKELWNQVPKLSFHREKKPHQLIRRVFSVNPHYLPRRNRRASFEECLHLLDYFDKKRRQLSST